MGLYDDSQTNINQIYSSYCESVSEGSDENPESPSSEGQSVADLQSSSNSIATPSEESTTDGCAKLLTDDVDKSLQSREFDTPKDKSNYAYSVTLLLEL